MNKMFAIQLYHTEYVCVRILQQKEDEWTPATFQYFNTSIFNLKKGLSVVDTCILSDLCSKCFFLQIKSFFTTGRWKKKKKKKLEIF